MSYGTNFVDLFRIAHDASILIVAVASITLIPQEARATTGARPKANWISAAAPSRATLHRIETG